MSTKTQHFASYHAGMFDQKERSKMIRHSVRLINTLRENDNSIYAIVGTGVSGILGAIVADACKMEFLYVRRANETPHDYRKVVGNIGPGKYVFYDDLLDSGKTLVHCLDTFKSLLRDSFGVVRAVPTMACVVCYDTARPYHSVQNRITGCNGSERYESLFSKTPAYSVPYFANTGKLSL
jgi:phosphoribosylpyrophosphate synthetase